VSTEQSHEPRPPELRLAGLQAVLFDLDGTLINSIELILASFRHATATVLGEALPDEVMLRDVGLPLARQMRDFSEEHAEELLRVYREHNARTHDELVRSYEGVDETLVWLARRGYKMGVVTSKIRALACRGLEVFDLARFFDVVVGSDDVTVHKPDPHPLLVAAEALGVPIGHCAYVGDSPHDMAAACAAGSVAVGAAWGVSTREVLVAAGAEYVIEAMEELRGLLGG
jgi:pyrophosphatase PpaX